MLQSPVTFKSANHLLSRGDALDQPNLVMVLCDTLRRNALDVYGGPVSTGPLLEALGARQLRTKASLKHIRHPL